MLGIKDLVTLDDKNKYLVANKTNIDGITYYMLVDIDNSKNYKFCYEVNEKNILKLIQIEDKKTINKLVIVFMKKYLGV